MKNVFATVALIAFVSPVWAAPQTVKLSVPGMNCATCPIMIKKVLHKIDGVGQAEVNYEKREALVTFDNEKTSVQKLTEATANAGYPSSVVL